MTDAPDMEQSALDELIAATKALLDFPGGAYAPALENRAKRALDAYLAARSAPEAGKAVDPVGWRYRGYFHDRPLPWQMTDQRWLADRQREAGEEVEPLFLASSPAPTGAPTGDIAGLVDELIGWAYRDKQWDANRWHLCASDTKPRPHEGREIQAVYLAATLTRLSAELEMWRSVKHSSYWKDRATAYEAEAVDLRAIISECAKALGNGAHIDPTCTVEFMRNLPEEIRLVVVDLRRKLEEHQDAEDKAAREMATVIQGLRNRATAAERKLEEARKALESAHNLIANTAFDAGEPHDWAVAVDEQIQSALAIPTAPSPRIPIMAKLTAARRRVLTKLVAAGGRAMPYDLAYPRSNMMHHLRMAGLVTVEGRLTGWGDPAHDGFYVITPAGRQALESDNG